MAITWKLEFGNINQASGRADVTAIRTDDQSTDPPRVYQFSNALITTQEDRDKLIEAIKAEDTKAAADLAEDRDFIANWDQAGKVALDAWELVR